MEKSMIVGIYAKDSNNAIGYKNNLPWPKNQKDMDFFKKTTSGHIVLMGKNTWKSIGEKCLSDRINVVISSGDVDECDHCYFNIRDAISELNELYPNKIIFVIGGNQIYKYFYENQLFDKIIVSEIAGAYDADTYIDDEDLKYFASSKLYSDEDLNITLYEKGKIEQ